MDELHYDQAIRDSKLTQALESSIRKWKKNEERETGTGWKNLLEKCLNWKEKNEE